MTKNNPLRVWLASQPLTVTQASFARDLGLSRSYVSELFSDDDPKQPSLQLSVAIEHLTHGAVTPGTIAAFITAKRRRAA
jgi:transcriptional regulator with XRE-family HTH domain